MKQLYCLYDLNLKITGKYKSLFGKDSVLFSDITNVEISGKYRPATIQECIENMTPIEFSKTYGDKIQLNINGK